MLYKLNSVKLVKLAETIKQNKKRLRNSNLLEVPNVAGRSNLRDGQFPGNIVVLFYEAVQSEKFETRQRARVPLVHDPCLCKRVEPTACEGGTLAELYNCEETEYFEPHFGRQKTSENSKKT